MATNGQLLERFLNGETLLPFEKQQLVRAVDEWDAGKQAVENALIGNRPMESPMIFDPNWRTSPLHAFHAYMTTDVNAANNTYVALTFDTSSGDTSVFDFWKSNKSKVRVDRGQFHVSIDGVIRWESNSSGDRVLRMKVYDSADVEIAAQELSVVRAAASAGFQTDMNFAYTEDIRGLFPQVAYMKLEGMQNSGVALNIQSAILSVRVA